MVNYFGFRLHSYVYTYRSQRYRYHHWGEKLVKLSGKPKPIFGMSDGESVARGHGSYKCCVKYAEITQ
jgi:hypothetical protein